MTIDEMQYLIGLRLQTINSASNLSFLSEEKDMFLNLAIQKFIKTRMNPLSNPKQQGLEDDQKRIDDLRGLIVRTSPVASSSAAGTPVATVPHSLKFVLPDNYMFYVYSQSHIAREGVTSGQWVKNTVIPHSELDKFVLNAYNTPIIREPRILFYAKDEIMLIHDRRDTVNAVEFVYIKQPAVVRSITPKVNCDLPEHTHMEIVDLAVEMIIETIESPRIQSFGPTQVATHE